MVKIHLKDAPEGAKYWRISIGVDAEVFEATYEVSEVATLPLDRFPEPYRSGYFNWFWIDFFRIIGGRELVVSPLWKDIHLEDWATYEYSYANNSLEMTEEPAPPWPALALLGGLSLGALVFLGIIGSQQ